MANTSGINSLPTYQAPSFNEASGVMLQIQNQVGNVNDLFAQVQSILKELQALDPPDIKAFTDAKGNVNTAGYNQAVASFQAQLANLNQRLESAYRKLGQGQALLQRLQSTDLPAAQRRDAQKMEKAMKDAQETLNGAAKTIAEASKGAEEGTSSTAAETRIEIRVRERKIELRLDKDPSFKDVISAFALMAVVVGQGRGEHKFTRVPPPAGGGLPPIGTA